MKRNYENLPHPIHEPEKFNQYLRDNNIVVLELEYFLIIRNSYIKKQNVAFCKLPVSDLEEVLYLLGSSKEALQDFTADFISIFMAYQKRNIYINAKEDRSVPDRFHIHIKH